MVPANVLFIRMKSCRSILTAWVNCDVMPVSTHVPPLRVSRSASRTSSAAISDGETTTASAMTPCVRSRTRSWASATVEALCVAPNRSADFRLNSTGSTATICAAPLIRAPWIAPVPIPPAPTTTTVSPPRTPARCAAEP